MEFVDEVVSPTLNPINTLRESIAIEGDQRASKSMATIYIYLAITCKGNSCFSFTLFDIYTTLNLTGFTNIDWINAFQGFPLTYYIVFWWKRKPDEFLLDSESALDCFDVLFAICFLAILCGFLLFIYLSTLGRSALFI